MDIEELYDADQDGILGSVVGYFSKGSHDPQSFATACNQDFDLANSGDSIVCVCDVKVGYLRKIPFSDGSGKWTIHKSSKPGKGAFLATYVFF